jgi:hypothetical protein
MDFVHQIPDILLQEKQKSMEVLRNFKQLILSKLIRFKMGRLGRRRSRAMQVPFI